MDVRLTPEQAQLADAAAEMASRLGPSNVGDLEDVDRRTRLRAALAEAGWASIRASDGSGAPWASGVEVGVVATALGTAPADVAFVGPVLASDLVRRSGADFDATTCTVALQPSMEHLVRVQTSETTERAVAIDSAEITSALVLRPTGDHFSLGVTALDGSDMASDLTRAMTWVEPGTAVTDIDGGSLTLDDLRGWASLAHATFSAELVGLMRGVQDLTLDYARDRRQYGRSIGSFQAIQHKLAEAEVVLEGSASITRHAEWAVDALEPGAALEAGAAAKAYSTRAARQVCETAIQVHGGIGNTWECMAHVYLRRALITSDLLGDDNHQLALLASRRSGATL